MKIPLIIPVDNPALESKGGIHIGFNDLPGAHLEEGLTTIIAIVATAYISAPYVDTGGGRRSALTKRYRLGNRITSTG
jgi:hypothetical protein